MWQIKIARHESMTLLKWLYYDISLPSLIRKRKVAEKALKLSQNWKRKNYAMI